MKSKTVLSRCQSRKFNVEMPLRSAFGGRSRTLTIRSAFSYGRGLSRTPSTKLKIAVLAPIPNASVSRATIAKPGLRASIRALYRKSCRSGAINVSNKQIATETGASLKKGQCIDTVGSDFVAKKLIRQPDDDCVPSLVHFPFRR